MKAGVVYAVGGTDPDSHPQAAHSLAWSTVMGCFGRSASKSDAEESKRRKEANKKINQQIQKDKQVYRATHRLLLLGISITYFPTSQVVTKRKEQSLGALLTCKNLQGM